MQEELRGVASMDALVGDNPVIEEFMHNVTVPQTEFFLHQLDIVDRAACSWLSILQVCDWLYMRVDLDTEVMLISGSCICV